MNVQAEEKAVYVGEGRYACEGDSVECVVLKQRNREQTRRAQERDEDKRGMSGPNFVNQSTGENMNHAGTESGSFY